MTGRVPATDKRQHGPDAMRTDHVPPISTLRCALAGIACLAIVILLLGIEASGILPKVTTELASQGAVSVEGHAYSYSLADTPAPFPGLVPLADSLAHSDRSQLILRENGHDIGMAHSLHVEIVELGAGRFSHWGNVLYASTPDNSDPRQNGRTYSAEIAYGFPSWIAQILALSGFFLLVYALSAVRQARRVSWADLAFLLGFLVLAALETTLLLRASGSPAIVASTDGGNISAWIAGLEFPQRFTTDFLLADPDNTAFYISVFLSAARLAGQVLGDVGRGYLALSFPILALQLVGYYLIGRVVTGSLLAGVILALLVNVPINVWGYNEIFGTYFVPLPRTAYDAILPYLIVAFLTFGDRTWLLPLLFALCGVSFYLHPVSAPGVAAGLLFASFVMRRPTEPFWQRFTVLFASGLVFLGCAYPFIIPFLQGFSGGLDQTSASVSSDLPNALRAFQERTGLLYQNAGFAMVTLLTELLRTLPVWLVGMFALVYLPKLNPNVARTCRFLLLFLSGVLLASLGISIIDQAIARQLGRPPVQIDLIRGMRFVHIAMLIGFVMAFSFACEVLGRRLSRRVHGFAIALCTLVLLVAWWTSYPNWLGWQLGLTPVPEWARPAGPDASRMMVYLREREVKGTILPLGDPTVGLAVRYAGLQPVAFLPNDSNALFYSGSDRRVDWYRMNNLLETVKVGQPEALATLLRCSEASYILLQESALPEAVDTWVRGNAEFLAKFGEWIFLRYNNQAVSFGSSCQ